MHEQELARIIEDNVTCDDFGVHGADKAARLIMDKANEGTLFETSAYWRAPTAYDKGILWIDAGGTVVLVDMLPVGPVNDGLHRANLILKRA